MRVSTPQDFSTFWLIGGTGCLLFSNASTAATRTMISRIQSRLFLVEPGFKGVDWESLELLLRDASVCKLVINPVIKKVLEAGETLTAQQILPQNHPHLA